MIVDENRADAQVSNPPVIMDIDAAYVSRPVPRSSNGTAEACVWIGNTAIVRRVRAHDCAWEGLWVGTAAHHALFEDIRVTNTLSASTSSTSPAPRRSDACRSARASTDGLICEWADPGWGSQPACVGQHDRAEHLRHRASSGSTSTKARQGRPCASRPLQTSAGPRSADYKGSTTSTTRAGTTTKGSRQGPSRSRKITTAARTARPGNAVESVHRAYRADEVGAVDQSALDRRSVRRVGHVGERRRRRSTRIIED